jgi:hypothetical protein
MLLRFPFLYRLGFKLFLKLRKISIMRKVTGNIYFGNNPRLQGAEHLSEIG